MNYKTNLSKPQERLLAIVAHHPNFSTRALAIAKGEYPNQANVLRDRLYILEDLGYVKSTTVDHRGLNTWLHWIITPKGEQILSITSHS